MEGQLTALKQSMVVLSKPRTNRVPGQSYIAGPGANPDFRPMEAHSTAPAGEHGGMGVC